MNKEMLEEARQFMLEETKKHGKNWKGYTTEEWMAKFANEKLYYTNIKLREHEERIKKLELRIKIIKEMTKAQNKKDEFTRTYYSEQEVEQK